jgi:3-oxoacyl-[acyl-carrier protein] reductase
MHRLGKRRTISTSPCASRICSRGEHATRPVWLENSGRSSSPGPTNLSGGCPLSAQKLEGQVALVTGGGRGVGEGIARELADAGARVAVSARTRDEVETVAREIGGLAVVADVSDRAAVESMVLQVEAELGPIDLLAANAGRNVREQHAWEVDPADWWNVFEVNVFGVYLCCRAVIPGMLERGGGRIVITGSGASYLPHSGSTAYSSSKAAVWRFGNVLAEQLEGRIPVFVISPGLVRTEMTRAAPDDLPWTPPELAPRLVRALFSGRADALSGRYIHAEHDDIDDLIRRADEIRDRDLNAIRLQR